MNNQKKKLPHQALFASKSNNSNPTNHPHFLSMKHGCVSRLGCGCGIRQFLKKVGAGAVGLGD